MSRVSEAPLVVKLGIGVAVAGLAGLVLVATTGETRAEGAPLATIATTGEMSAESAQPVAREQQSNFMGGAPEILDPPDPAMRILRLRFPAGVRSNWHTHTDGQLLMVESGHGLTQVRGGPIEEKGPGEPWWTPAGVEHWHGAPPDEDVVQLTIYGGSVDWLDPVTDDQYRAPARR